MSAASEALIDTKIRAPFDGRYIMLGCPKSQYGRVELSVDLDYTTMQVRRVDEGPLQIRDFGYGEAGIGVFGLREPTDEFGFAFNTDLRAWLPTRPELVASQPTIDYFSDLVRTAVRATATMV